MPEYPPGSLWLLLMEDSPTWPPLFYATCHHLIGPLVVPKEPRELLLAYKYEGRG
jgi:hypothetical protein